MNSWWWQLLKASELEGLKKELKKIEAPMTADFGAFRKKIEIAGNRWEANERGRSGRTARPGGLRDRGTFCVALVSSPQVQCRDQEARGHRRPPPRGRDAGQTATANGDEKSAYEALT